jgi:hypothetical protein
MAFADTSRLLEVCGHLYLVPLFLVPFIVPAAVAKLEIAVIGPIRMWRFSVWRKLLPIPNGVQDLFSVRVAPVPCPINSSTFPTPQCTYRVIVPNHFRNAESTPRCIPKVV